MNQTQNKQLVYTPKEKIPIGEAVLTESGNLALKLKKPGKNAHEIITLENLYSLVFKATEGRKCAGLPVTEAVRKD